MAVTVNLLTEPFTYSVVNSECWYQLNSASSSLNNFEYYYDVYTYDQFDNNLLINDLGLYFVPPRPNTGDAVFSPHKALKTQISNRYPLSHNIGLTALTPFTHSYIPYNIDYGFQYSPINLTFSTVDGSGSLDLIFSTAQDINTGDILTIQMQNLGLNPQYNTTASVVSETAHQIIQTDILYGIAPPTAEIGYITQLSRLVATATDLRFGWNGTRQYNQRYDDFQYYVIDEPIEVPTKQFLTTYTSSYISLTSSVRPTIVKEIFINQAEIQSILIDRTHTSTISPDWIAQNINVNTFNSSWGTISSYNFAQVATQSDYKYWAAPIGTQNLGGLGVSFTGVTYYNVNISGKTVFAGTQSLATIYRKIVGQCTAYKNVRIMFSNSQGGWEFYNFNKDLMQTRDVTRSMYRKTLAWDYRLGDRNDTVLAEKVQDSFVANSDWISQYDQNYLNELITTFDAYVVDENNNNLYPIIITDTSWEYKTYLRDVIFNATINYTMAFDINTQSE